MTAPTACIVCRREIESACEPGEWQPADALTFLAYGQYGCCVFDPMDGSSVRVNVCDPCMVTLAADGLVLYTRGDDMKYDVEPLPPGMISALPVPDA